MAEAKVDVEYWSSMAQVLPIFALGVIIEARTVSARWGANTSRNTRRWQSSLWVLVITACVIGEVRSLSAIRGEQISERWSVFCEMTVVVSVAVLVIAPLLDLVARSNADDVARLVLPNWMIRRSTRRHRKELVKVQRQVVALRRDAWDLVANSDGYKVRAEEAARFWGLAVLDETDDAAHAREMLKESESLISTTEDSAQKAHHAWRSLIRMELELHALHRTFDLEIPGHVAALVEKARTLLATQLANQNGLSSKALDEVLVVLGETDEPDDGGFFGASHSHDGR